MTAADVMGQRAPPATPMAPALGALTITDDAEVAKEFGLAPRREDEAS
jgi:hypothetical protein